LSGSGLKKLIKDKMVHGLTSKDIPNEDEFCETCTQGKIHRLPFPTEGGNRATAPLELVHSDVCGKINTKSLGGGEYFLTFIDDQTRFVWVYILKCKSEVFKCFKEWKTIVERSLGRKVITLRTDNGGEYTSSDFKSYLEKEGIQH
jgi:transposase InsO family protein